MRPALLCTLIVALAQPAAADDALSRPSRHADPPPTQDMTARAEAAAEAQLRERCRALRGRLRHSPFGRPLVLESEQAGGRLEGDVFALVDQPLPAVAAAFSRPAHWCEALLLNPQIAQCGVDTEGGRVALAISLVTRFDQPLSEAHAARFRLDTGHPSADFFTAQLRAAQGPMGTRDYRIVLQAVPVENGKTFLHLRYAYSYGLAARLAMQAYLGTSGRDKVGFTRIGTDAGGRPRYVDGLRGAMERNAVRYFLAIEAFLAAGAAPPETRFERALQRWLAAVERHPQLAEENPAAYLAEKQRQHRMQLALR